jgi:integrase
MMGLTVKSVRALIAKGEKGRHLDANGLYLQILSPTNSSWLYRYEFRGKKRWLGLGPTNAFDLVEARERHRRARQALFDGNDPLAVKRNEHAQRAAEAARNKTLAQVVNEYLETHEAAWSRRHRYDFLSKMNLHILPQLGDMPVAIINDAQIVYTLKPLWLTKTVTAQRTLQTLAQVFDYSIACQYCTANPATWRGRLEHRLPKPEKLVTTKNFAALPYIDMPEFMRELRGMQGIPAKALEFLILTATRSNEVIGAQWSEIDLQAKVWTIPANRVKNRKPHRVALSAAVVRLLKSLPREEAYLFPGSREGAPMGGGKALRKALGDLRPGLHVHGFRASFKTWATQRTTFPRELVEEALAHIIGNKVERAYLRDDRLELRRPLMEAWSDYVESTPIEGDVVMLRARS